METSNAPAIVAGSPPRWRGILIVLLVNAVPIVGVLRYGWSATNVLVLYWFENLMVAICTTVRLAVHRRLSRKRGYFRSGVIGGIKVNGKPSEMSLVGEYAVVAFVFTLAHGIFVGAIAFMLTENHPDDPVWHLSLPQLMRGVEVIAAMLGIELIVDLATIRSRPFAWAKDYAQRRMGRIFVLHLAIIFGMFAMAMTQSPFAILYVLIGLKTFVELGGVYAQGPQPAESDVPPGWALKFADKVAKDKGGSAALLKDLKAQGDKARREAIEDEEILR